MNSHTTEPHAKGEFGEPPARDAGPGIGYYVRKVLKPLASLQLTVVLFSLSMLLIFFGTMAQIEYGIWTVVEKYFWSWYVDVPFDLFRKFLGVFWQEYFPAGGTWGGSFPFPAGKLLGGAMLVNLLAAHALRFRVSWKRAGIFLIHSGLILLFVGEFITREYAIEQRMTIEEGKSANFAEDARFVEYAFTDPSDPTADQVVTIPENLLKKPGGRITHPDLPVDVEVVGEFMINASLTRANTSATNPADRGVGTMWVANKQKEVSGLDEQKVNVPAVYLKFYKKGTDQSLGTYLASLQIYLVGGDDEIEVDGKTYHGVLRFKRYHKPYRIYLDQFRFDRYTGTQKAKNFSSDVRVYDEAGNLVRQQRIAMNEPLRYNGETFYQQSFDKSETTTILQVVKNPGWWLPYIACIVVGLGLIVHFSIFLIQFLRRNAAKPTATGDAALLVPNAATSLTAKIVPCVIVGLAALYLLSVLGRMGPPKQPVNFDAAGRMPVVDGGRVKPLDTFARVHLRMISGKEEFVDDKGNKQPAIRFYFDLLAGGNPQERGDVWKYKVIRIDNEMVLNELKLEKREGFRYSMEEIAPKIDLIQQRMIVLRQKAAKGEKPDVDEAKFKELYDRLSTFMELAEHGGALLLPPGGETKDWSSLREFRMKAMEQSVITGMSEARKKIAPKIEKLSADDEIRLLTALGMKPDKLTAAERADFRDRVVTLLKADPMRMPEPKARQMWLNTAFALMTEKEEMDIRGMIRDDYERRLAAHPAAVTWEKMVTAYREGRPNDFAREVEEYRTKHAADVADKNPTTNVVDWVIYTPFNWLGRNKVEIMFNRFAPFYQCAGLYVLAFVLAMAGFTQQAAQRPVWATALRRSSFYLLIFTLIIHTIALFARMYIMERPLVFVTNLYSSAVFIGWGCVGLCLIIELIFRIGVGNVLAAILGLATTIVAHNIASEDTLEMMQAVLDTNFWLATHVTTVTLGYTATFVAGFLGALYVFQMLAAVIRDSYKKTGEPTVGDLFAFGAASTGMVGIPLFFIWFMTNAMKKYEVLPVMLIDGIFWLTFGVGVMYALALMLLRVSSTGLDAGGKPVAGEVPGFAKPVEALALTPERSKIFGQMVYGVICFATLLSFIGTVLGGIWADQSWGRFWGWDPKENGAVLIVLWNSLILHARWAGLVKDRGVAVLAIFGNAITAWSWFGTNQLQIGLHAYGFDSRLADGCFNFWVSQMFILALGLIPQRFWSGASGRATAPVVQTATVAPDANSRQPNATAVPVAPPPAEPNNQQARNGQQNGHTRRDKRKRHGKR